MGMFDYIQDKIYCPYCGKLSNEQEYQTKRLACMLDRLTIKDIIKYGEDIDEVIFYSECNHCKKWVEITLLVKRERIEEGEKE